EPGQRFTFYEIDPAVAGVARDSGLFSYLADSEATVDVVLGDARLRLREAPPRSYGLIVVDAFASDVIPIHLLDSEAFALYLDKLEPDGLLALHISNRYLALAPIVWRLAREHRLSGMLQTWTGSDGCARVSTTWVLLARDPAHLGALAKSEWW